MRNTRKNFNKIRKLITTNVKTIRLKGAVTKRLKYLLQKSFKSNSLPHVIKRNIINKIK